MQTKMEDDKEHYFTEKKTSFFSSICLVPSSHRDHLCMYVNWLLLHAKDLHVMEGETTVGWQ